MPTDLTVILEHRPGELARLAEMTGETGVTIHGLAAFTGEGRGVVHLLLDDGAVAGCRAALERAGMGIADEREVFVIDVEDRPAALGELTRQLAEANVNVDLAYTTFTGGKIVIATDDVGSARAVLRQVGITVAVLGALGLPDRSGGRWNRRAAAVIAAAGLLAAGTAAALAATGRLDAHGMIAIPALHDAASDRPIRYAPVCSHDAIPVCLNPAYTVYLPAVTAALEPVLSQVAGLPGAPAGINQAAATYQQGPGNSVNIGLAGGISGTPPEFHLVLPDQLSGPTMTTSEIAAQVRWAAGLKILANVIGVPRSGASPAQQAVMAALMKVAAVPPSAPPAPGVPPPAAAPLPAPISAAAQRFAALPPAARHDWLVKHLAALRAGRITLAQLP